MTDEGRGGAWLKLPTRITDVLEAVSLDASGVYLELSAYSSKLDTRGVIRWDDVRVAVRRKVTDARAAKLVGELADRGIVTFDDEQIDLGDSWREWNPPADTWQDDTKRERWRRAKALGRDTELRNRVKARDRNLCRYCGLRVNWNDKVGPKGGTYDHVDPDGENTFDNVVVSCRRCNGRKKDRTPEQWVDETRGLRGLALPLKPGTTAEQYARLLAEAQAREGPDPASPESAPGQPAEGPRARDRTGSTRGQPAAPRHDLGSTRPDNGDADRRHLSSVEPPAPPPPDDQHYTGERSA